MSNSEADPSERSEERGGRFGRFGWTFAGALVLATGIATTVFFGQADDSGNTRPPAAPLVETASPSTVDGVPFVSATGFLQPAERVVVSAERATRVGTVSPSFRIGARVSADDVLVTMQTDRLDTSLQQASAQLNQARASAKEADKALRRQRDLVAREFASDASLDRARAEAASARARVEVAEAAVQAAEVDLNESSLVAPFDALVLDEQVSPGELVQPGQALGELIAVDSVEVVVGLSPAAFALTAGQSLPGEAVDVHFDEPTPTQAQGTVTAVTPRLDERTRTIDLTIRIDRPFDREPPLILNTLARVEIPWRDRDGALLRLPLRALQPDRSIWQIDDTDRLKRVEARILREEDDGVVVQAGSLGTTARILATPLPNPVEGLRVRPGGGPEQVAAR